jgi:hypothetical protein
MRELHLLKVALSQKVSHSPEHYPLKQKNCKGEYLALTFCGDWSQSKKLSEIKPPLSYNYFIMIQKNVMNNIFDCGTLTE